MLSVNYPIQPWIYHITAYAGSMQKVVDSTYYKHAYKSNWTFPILWWCFSLKKVLYVFPSIAKSYESVKITTGRSRKNTLDENKSKVLDLFKTRSLSPSYHKH